jgi:DHA1 family bicyclomycin/chloramphenicol resistance-like MFS transporter
MTYKFRGRTYGESAAECDLEPFLKRLQPTEYIILVALLVSIGAMGTGIMLPALDEIGRALSVGDANVVQFIISLFSLGMGVGQLLVGPLSDRFGRKPVIYVGYEVFVAGCLLSLTTESWAIMLTGRFLQGVGAAAPRVVSVALVWDEYEGRAMARIMSIVMAVFILVPITAPALGQGLIFLGGWRATFLGLTALVILVKIWFALRQPETLLRADRRPLNLSKI